MAGLYVFEENQSLRELLTCNHEQVKIFAEMKALKPDLWLAVQKKLKVRWTADSNAIEGSTLTFAETLFFLEEGLTVEGKPLKDFLDARNHAEAIDFLMGVVTDERPISTSLIREINALLLSGVKSTPAMDQRGRQIEKPATPGEYKKLPNHVVQADGTIHRYVDPINVAQEMEELVSWINDQTGKLDPIVVAAIAHYNFVRIHPFDDGNGRGARILMNLVLMKAGLLPAVIVNHTRRAYIEALQAADKGLLLPFVIFVSQSMYETVKSVVEDLKREINET